MSDVVVGVDGSEAASRAVGWAAEEAARHGAGLRLVHASLWERYEAGAEGDENDKFFQEARDASRRLLAHQAERVRTVHPTLEVTSEVLPEETVPALMAAGRQSGLLVLGSRGLGAVKGLLLGSVSQRVAGRAAFPVVIVPENARWGGHGRVVLGLGARQPPQEAGKFAAAEAAARGARLEVVHAWEPDLDLSALTVLADVGAPERRARALVAAVAAELEQSAPGVEVRGRAVPGPAAPALLETAADADLLVLGVRKRHGGLGHVAHSVLHRASCPVALVPLAAGSA